MKKIYKSFFFIVLISFISIFNLNSSISQTPVINNYPVHKGDEHTYLVTKSKFLSTNSIPAIFTNVPSGPPTAQFNITQGSKIQIVVFNITQFTDHFSSGNSIQDFIISNSTLILPNSSNYHFFSNTFIGTSSSNISDARNAYKNEFSNLLLLLGNANMTLSNNSASINIDVPLIGSIRSSFEGNNIFLKINFSLFISEFSFDYNYNPLNSNPCSFDIPGLGLQLPANLISLVNNSINLESWEYNWKTGWLDSLNATTTFPNGSLIYNFQLQKIPNPIDFNTYMNLLDISVVGTIIISLVVIIFVWYSYRRYRTKVISEKISFPNYLRKQLKYENFRYKKESDPHSNNNIDKELDIIEEILQENSN